MKQLLNEPAIELSDSCILWCTKLSQVSINIFPPMCIHRLTKTVIGENAKLAKHTKNHGTIFKRSIKQR